jgi:hypothetical protein
MQELQNSEFEDCGLGVSCFCSRWTNGLGRIIGFGCVYVHAVSLEGHITSGGDDT